MDIKPEAMAIPKGTDHVELPKTPAGYGFSCRGKGQPGW